MFSSIHLKSRVENQKVLSASVLLFLILWSVIFPSPLSFFRGMRSWTSQSSKFGAISIGNCLQSGRPLLVGALFPAFLWFLFWAAVANSMFYICHRLEWWMLPVETMLHHHKCCFGWCHESANCHSTSCLLVQSCGVVLVFARPLNSSKDGNAAACNDIQENSVLPVFWQQFREIPFLLHMTMPLYANWCP